MESKPLVSVLMTVYNREKYIAEAIESVMASTYQNWELIIVDDRSKDQSVAIAESFAEKDKRVKVYLNEKNLGDYPNRNQAAGYAKGKYIKYVDADDMIYEHTLGYMVEMMEGYPDAHWAVFSYKQNPNKPYPYLADPEEQYKGHYLEGLGYFLRSPLSAIIRTDVFKSENGFKERKMVGDYEMWHRLGSKFNLLVLPHSHGFVWYRTHEQQQSSEIDKFAGEYRKISLDYLSNHDSPLNKEDTDEAIKQLNKRHFVKAFKLLATFKFRQLKYI